MYFRTVVGKIYKNEDIGQGQINIVQCIFENAAFGSCMIIALLLRLADQYFCRDIPSQRGIVPELWGEG